MNCFQSFIMFKCFSPLYDLNNCVLTKSHLISAVKNILSVCGNIQNVQNVENS